MIFNESKKVIYPGEGCYRTPQVSNNYVGICMTYGSGNKYDYKSVNLL